MTNLTAIEIGTSPAGVEWVCYPRPGDDAASLAARADRMRTALDRLEAKLAEVSERGFGRPRPVRTVKLTRGESRWLDFSMQNLPDPELVDADDWGRLSSECRRGATYVRGTDEDLDVLATCASNVLESDDHVDAVGAPEGSALWDRNLAAAERCLRSVVAKLSRSAGSKE